MKQPAHSAQSSRTTHNIATEENTTEPTTQMVGDSECNQVSDSMGESEAVGKDRQLMDKLVGTQRARGQNAEALEWLAGFADFMTVGTTGNPKPSSGKAFQPKMPGIAPLC